MIKSDTLPLPSNPSHATVLLALAKVAAAGERLPTGTQLAEATGHADGSTALKAIQSLERDGFIKVHRDRSQRWIEIVSTGACTAPQSKKSTKARPSRAKLSNAGRPNARRNAATLDAVFEIIERAANIGARSPTNDDLAAAMGVSSSSSAGRWIDALVAQERIRVSYRNDRFRIFEIVATGNRTADEPGAVKLEIAFVRPPRPTASTKLAPLDPFSLPEALAYLRSEGFDIARAGVRGRWLIGDTNHDAAEVIAFAERMRDGMRRAA